MSNEETITTREEILAELEGRLSEVEKGLYEQFIAEYKEIREKYGYEVTASPRMVLNSDGAFVTVLDYLVTKINKGGE